MILNLAYYGDPILRKKAALVKEITPEIRAFVNDMIETLQACSNGIGLAAPQVQKSLAIFLVQFPDPNFPDKWVPGDLEVHINPKILKISDEFALHAEGCLSIPKIYADVPRPVKITFQSMNLNGEIVVKDYEGFSARMLMHENDHVNGVLFIDRISHEDRKMIEPKLREIKKKYRRCY